MAGLRGKHAEFHSASGELLRIHIRVTPGSRKEGFGDLFTDSEGNQWLKAHVRAVPEDGKANAALIRLLANTLGIAKSGIRHLGGQTGRMKVFELPFAPEVQEILLKIGRD